MRTNSIQRSIVHAYQSSAAFYLSLTLELSPSTRLFHRAAIYHGKRSASESVFFFHFAGDLYLLCKELFVLHKTKQHRNACSIFSFKGISKVFISSLNFIHLLSNTLFPCIFRTTLPCFCDVPETNLSIFSYYKWF